MKRRLLLCQSLFCLAGAAGHANATTIVVTQFQETLIYGTDTFETSGGTVQSSLQYVFISDEIPSDIASDISADPTFAASDPAAQSFIQSTASEAALTDDLTFLTSQLPTVFYTSASATVYTGVYSCCPLEPLATLFPGYSVVSQTPTSIGQNTYNTAAIEPSGTVIEGVITFNEYELDLVEQPSTTTPEPSSLPLIGSGLLAFAYRRFAT